VSEPWQELALCAQIGDDTLWFPEQGVSNRVKEAKRVCLMCEARTACLADALNKDEPFGIRGAFTVQERRRIKRGLPPEKPKVSTRRVTPYRNEYGHGINCQCAMCRRLRGAA